MESFLIIAILVAAFIVLVRSVSRKTGGPAPESDLPWNKPKPTSGPGYYKGKHFTAYVEDFKALKREGKLDETEELLLHLVDATEAESKADGMVVAPAYYEHLAIIYRKQNEREKELAILDRYAAQEHPQEAKLMERREKVRKLLAQKPST